MFGKHAMQAWMEDLEMEGWWLVMKWATISLLWTALGTEIALNHLYF